MSKLVKFRWIPNSPENERKFLEEMKKTYDITEKAVDKIQKELLEKTADKATLSKFMSNNIIPTLASMRIKIGFAPAKPIRDENGGLICYICQMKVTPPALEDTVKLTATRLGAGKFMAIFGFNYGKVEFFK